MSTFPRLACAVSLAFAALTAWAGATKPEVVAQVDSALALLKKVGPEQGIKDINSDAAWKTNEMNVTVTDTHGQVLASSLNEKLRGKVTLEIQDPNGKQFIKEALALAASKGQGWVDYQFINPGTKKLEDRTMFVKRYQGPGFDGVVCVSISR